MPEYTKFIRPLAEADADRVEAKDAEYGASWLRRGGVGAYHVMVRKIDRLETQSQRHGYDIFSALSDGGPGEGLVDTIRDLRGYLLLIEAEAVAREIVEPERRQPAPRPECTVSFSQDDQRRVCAEIEGAPRTLLGRLFLSDLAEGRAVGINDEVVRRQPAPRDELPLKLNMAVETVAGRTPPTLPFIEGHVSVPRSSYEAAQRVVGWAAAQVGVTREPGVDFAACVAAALPPKVELPGPGYLRDEVRAMAMLMEEQFRTKDEGYRGNSWKDGAVSVLTALSAALRHAQDAFSRQQVIEAAKRLHTPSEDIPEEILARHRAEIRRHLIASANYALITLDVMGELPRKTPLEIAAEFHTLASGGLVDNDGGEAGHVGPLDGE